MSDKLISLQIVYRDWEYKDILQIAEIEKKTFKDYWNYNMLADTFISGNFYGVVAEGGNKIIGYGGFIYTEGICDITTVAVDEKFRRKSIGINIVGALLKKAAKMDIKKLFLEVRPSNAAAISLYEKAGFVKEGVRKKYYGDGEDALIYFKSI